MDIQIFDPEVHTIETHWSYPDDSLSPEENMEKVNKYFKCSTSIQTLKEEASFEISFGAYVVVNEGMWGSLNEYARVKSLVPSRILNYAFMSGRRDIFGRRGGFQSSGGNWDYKLELEYC